MRRLNLLLVCCVGLALPAPAAAVETAFWQVGSFDELIRGKLSGVSLSKDGELRLAPQSQTVFSPDEALALSLTADRNRNLYVGTGHQGKVFRLDASLKSSLFFTAQEPDVFALAVGPDGALYVGSSPEGKIYRVAEDGKSKVFYDPKAKYIWALAFDKGGRLYVGTGDKGQILRVDATGKGEVFYNSTQTHIMCLVFDREGNLLAGSVPLGLIYRITPAGKAFVVYQSSFPEIHELATDAQGQIYAAALGGASGKGTPELLLAPTPGMPTLAPTATVTVVAGSEGLGQSPAPAAQTQRPQAGTISPSFNRATPAGGGFPVLPAFQGRGALIVIRADSTAELAWSSNNESIFGLALRDGHVLFSTDSSGRIFDLDPSRDGQKLTLVAETQESLATRLLLQDESLFVSTSSAAKLIRISAGLTREGTYESSVKDTKFVSRWGALAWRADVPAGTSLELYVRSGNSERPDGTWSDWTGPYHNSDGAPVSSAPAARYVQWKAILRAQGSSTPTLDEVTLPYLTQNVAPQIRTFSVSTGTERTSLAGAGLSGGTASAAGLNLAAQAGFGVLPSAVGPKPKPPMTLSWQAEDPNGDQLVYSLYLKGIEEQEWHLLKDKLHQTSYTLDSNILADGKYLARVVASDEEDNPPSTARRAELVSAPFWVDNTPPQLRVLKSAISGNEAAIQFQVEDNMSPLRNAEVAIDSEDWHTQPSDDGIVDSRVETFTVRASKLVPGEHLVALRAYDTAGNVGVNRFVIRIPGKQGTSH
jgi:outer membrane protein assembly factor BamB